LDTQSAGSDGALWLKIEWYKGRARKSQKLGNFRRRIRGKDETVGITRGRLWSGKSIESPGHLFAAGNRVGDILRPKIPRRRKLKSWSKTNLDSLSEGTRHFFGESRKHDATRCTSIEAFKKTRAEQ
jgi:hypothetical protein